MDFFSLFKPAKPRQFEYTPRYWDPRKEALDERIRRIEAEIAAEKGQPVDYHGTTLRKGFLREAGTIRKKHQRSSSLRLLIILVFLLYIAYMLFYR